MSDKLFEIAFSGKIADGADADRVKQAVGQMFKADEARLAQLFSGRRVIIKKQADEITVAKYRGAFQKAGAVCDIRALDEPASQPNQAAEPPAPAAATAAAAPAAQDYVSRYPESEQIPQALLTEPLGIKGDQIADLSADLAPVGERLLHDYKEAPEPAIDISGFDVAPVGSDLGGKKNEDVPPPPDTSGLSLAD